MHMINMGCLDEIPHLPSLLVLVENMTMNASLTNESLKNDLFSSEQGDQSVNCVRAIVKETYHHIFCNLNNKIALI